MIKSRLSLQISLPVIRYVEGKEKAVGFFGNCSLRNEFTTFPLSVDSHVASFFSNSPLLLCAGMARMDCRVYRVPRQSTFPVVILQY